MTQQQYAPVLIQVPAPYNANPWVLKRLDRELAFLDDASPHKILEEVLAQYQGHEDAAGDCPCGGKYWYNATTGGHKCPECRTFTTPAGEVLGASRV